MQQAATASPSPLRYFSVLICATFLIGSSTVASKLLLVSFPPMALVGWRFMAAAILTIPIVLLFDKGMAIRTPSTHPLKGFRLWVLILSIGTLQTSAVMGFLYLSMLYVPAPIAAILLFSNPIWVALLERVFFKETLSKTQSVGLVLGIAGVVMAIGPTQDEMLKGTILGLISSFCWASSTILTKHSAPPLKSWTLSFWQMFSGSVILLVISFILHEEWPHNVSLTEWLWFAWLVGPATAVAFGLWYVALGWGGTTKTSSFLFLCPLFTTLISHTIIGNELTLLQALGGIFIGSALWLINQKTVKAAPRRLMV